MNFVDKIRRERANNLFLVRGNDSTGRAAWYFVLVDPAKKAAFKKGEWNKYRVKAQGKSIKTWINDVPVADLVDEKSNMPKGFLGLQVHGIAKGTGPYEVRWRNIAIKELPASE